MTDSCPTGITFGDTVTLSPSGEKVLNLHTPYFNNIKNNAFFEE